MESKVRAIAEEHGLAWSLLGEVGGSAVAIEGALSVEVDVLADAHHRCLESIVGAD
jgi:hypothetical protein